MLPILEVMDDQLLLELVTVVLVRVLETCLLRLLRAQFLCVAPTGILRKMKSPQIPRLFYAGNLQVRHLEVPVKMLLSLGA